MRERNSSGIKVIRRWKRDKSENEMSIEDAAINLAASCTDAKMRVKGSKKIQDYLEAGVIMETTNAEFFIKDVVQPIQIEESKKWFL